ncbi:MAG TPA: DUF2279 domain-containing protein [Campylobacteraceae bacterium]|nr:DUF2279 domain-containing protein [Campylobacteraceae bacterium]
MLWASLLALPLRAGWLEENRKIVRTNLIGSAVILTWGYFTWDYGSRAPHFAHEGWFGKKTKHGGMDKLGHLYTNYLLTQILAARFRDYGYTQRYAACTGAISSFFLNGVMEVGDSFGDYGFSYEDIIFNAVGASLGYLMLTERTIDDAVDIRISYLPSRRVRSGADTDIFTDYEGMKFLAAYKFSSLPGSRTHFWRYLELHAGYYVRSEGGQNRRYPYLGIGINFSTLLAPLGRNLSRLFEFYQPPLGYIPVTPK